MPGALLAYPAAVFLLALALGGTQGPALAPVAQTGAGLGLAGPDLPPPLPRIGIDAEGVGALRAQGVEVTYGMLWVGKWNLDRGWRGTDEALLGLAAQNVTPVVQLYYWGDDIHPRCFVEGCEGKDVASWERLVADLAAHLDATLGGKVAIVVLESEFNKDQVREDEALDGLLEQRALQLKAAYPAAWVVLGLGNWYHKTWPTWDRAAAASDGIGLQAVRVPSLEEAGRRTVLEELAEGAQAAHDLFGKPVMLHDVALSSHPEPSGLEMQEAAFIDLAGGLPALRQAGVDAVVFRSWRDVPDMALDNHFGEAERHWGLAWADTGEPKPAGKALVEALRPA